MSILQTPDLQIGADQSLVDEGDVFRDHFVKLQLNSASSSRPTKFVFAENVFWLLRHKFDLLKHNFLPESSNVCFSPERNDVRFCQTKLKRKMRKIQI